MDLHALIKMPITMYPGERRLFPTGLSAAIERGYEGQIRSRSGLTFKHGIIVLNAPGTIDADYRGEIGVILFNAGDEKYHINSGDRIAQMVISKIEQPVICIVGDSEELDQTTRGEGGFGSTGYHAS